MAAAGEGVDNYSETKTFDSIPDEVLHLVRRLQGCFFFFFFFFFCCARLSLSSIASRLPDFAQIIATKNIDYI